MQKLSIIFLLVISPLLLLAQSRTQIKLETAERATGNIKLGANYLRKPVFSHDGAILTCDSAVLYQNRNFFEAFGNVHINQGDTLNIYSDFLNYDGNAKKAHLDKNVKLLDQGNTLTSNVLDYDMAARLGKYTTGGKLVNKDATITSKEGFYFASTKDAYFKIDVLVVTAEKATITSQDLRYNTGTNWTYFYGPTNIKSKEDHLYTENGAYNTKSENAYFGKKNLYTNGSRSLKGDSLYYYGKTGYGKAVKNIFFRDTKDQTLLRGQLGEYYRADERIVVTQKAYVGIGTKDTIEVNSKKMPDTLWLSADTLESQRSLVKDLSLLSRPMVKKDNEVGAEDEQEKAEKDKEKAEARRLLEQEGKKLLNPSSARPSNPSKKLSRKEKKALEKAGSLLPKTEDPPTPAVDSLALMAKNLKRDSLVADSLLKLKKQMPVVKSDSLKATVEKAAAKALANTSGKPATKDPTIAKTALTLSADTPVTNPLDTVRARTIKAFHNVRVYKSNMQAKADSLFYNAADSTLRWYQNPILWSNGTQQTGDTIHVFFKNSKIHNFQVLHNGFIVNVEGDSTKFNQVKGKIITGFFHEGELKNVYVDGNAESIYFSKNDKGEYDNVSQTVSSRLRFRFKEKELTDIVTVREVEGAVDPVDKLTKESLLTGFIWKPELRPTSKADIIKGLTAPKPKPAAKAPVKSTTGKAVTIKAVKTTPKTAAKEAVLKAETKPTTVAKAPSKASDSVKVDTLIKQK